ncbi:MAG: hypothetical protein KBD19_03435 [Candidatus Moranbacteria bacterium]|nr:hypothetical protein [Candidatus Moranbacteria bacterium]
MASPETIATNRPEEAEREVPVLERAEQSISPEEQVKQAMEAAEAAKKEFDPTEADAEMARDRSEYAERLSASPEVIAEADEAIAGDLSAIRKEELGILARLNEKLRKYASVVALTAATAGPAAAMENPTSDIQSESDTAKIVEVIPGDIPKPEIPLMLKIDTNLSEVSDNRVIDGSERGTSEKSELSDPMEEFGRQLGVFGSRRGDIDAVIPTDPIVLRLTRELEDPEGVFKEGEVVMEGYEGFTEKQLRSLQKISELADREFSFVFSTEGDGKVVTRSRERQGKVSGVVDDEMIYESLRQGKETIAAHTHPARNTSNYAPSFTDLTSNLLLKQVASEKGYDAKNLRDVAVARNGIWEYSVDQEHAAAESIEKIVEFRSALVEVADDEIKKLRIGSEEEASLRSRLETMDMFDIEAASMEGSDDDPLKHISRAIMKKMNRTAGRLVNSSAGKLLIEFTSKAGRVGFGESQQSRDDFIRWGMANGIQLKFTPFPEKILSGE